ncbi:cysteine-rich CWC family protein [Photobacterium aquae]|uniref:cysteine-rich CWC family protein n=1 Tax=Photobacterium aquae TaxID=1195763 RepID=UPI003B84850F
MKEIELWRTLNDNQQEKIMGEIRGIASTHLCSQCGEPAHCDLSAGRSTCWCSTVAPRDTSGIDTEKCLCRKCLEKLPLL